MRGVWWAVAGLTLLLPRAGAAQGVWENRASYPIAATEVSAVAINGKVYALCGITPSGSVNSLFIYDPATDAWRSGAAIPIPPGADHCNVAAAGGKLYLLGALGVLSGNPNTYEYDPATDRWRTVGAMPTPRGASGVGAIGSKIYVAGGLFHDSSVATFEVFDTATRQWTPLPDMPTARDHLTAQAVNGKFYAISGRVGDVLRANEEYDPATSTWRARAPILTPRGGIGSGTLRNRIQVFGGEGPSGTPEGTYRQNEEYDPATDTWQSLAPMPLPRHGLYGATILNPDGSGCIYTPSGGPHAGANFSNIHQAFCLAPDEAPAINAGGVINAASFQPAISPGTLVTLFGRRFAATDLSAASFPLPTEMAGVSVKANGAPVALLFVSSAQINFYLPHDFASAGLSLTVSRGGVESAATMTPLSSSSPSIFLLTGSGQGAILIAGTGLAAAQEGSVRGLASRPARKGEVVEIYCAGLGGIAGALARGAAAPSQPPLRTLAQPSATIAARRWRFCSRVSRRDWPASIRSTRACPPARQRARLRRS